MKIRIIRTLLFAFGMLAMSEASFAQIRVGVGITIGPPPIPIYEQPICPGDGYIWTPGYCAYDDDLADYYWVPGTWIMAPEIGFLWTPGWWGWSDGVFLFHEGYWGPQIGFYGGINYGFGYFGTGFEGGRWDNGHFFYNRAVANVNVTDMHNVYNTTVVNNNNHVSFNGGNGGTTARPTPQEEAAASERHAGPVAEQTRNVQAARSDPQQRASVNIGKPAVAATPKAGDLKDRGVVHAREAGGSYTPPVNRGGNQPRDNATAPHPENNNNAERPSTPTHISDLPPAEQPAAPNTGDPKLDKKYQQQQEKLYNQQQAVRQKVAQRQEKEDQQLAKQKAPDEKRQQQEQRHQQQTSQLQQKHQQQQQQLQQRQPAPRPSRPRN